MFKLLKGLNDFLGIAKSFRSVYLKINDYE